MCLCVCVLRVYVCIECVLSFSIICLWAVCECVCLVCAYMCMLCVSFLVFSFVLVCVCVCDFFFLLRARAHCTCYERAIVRVFECGACVSHFCAGMYLLCVRVYLSV